MKKTIQRKRKEIYQFGFVPKNSQKWMMIAASAYLEGGGKQGEDSSYLINRRD